MSILANQRDTRYQADRAGSPAEVSAVPGDLQSHLKLFEPISLLELNDQAELMARTDRKYFVPVELFADLLKRTAADFRILEIGGQRHFRYRSVYFDTPEFSFYRHHVQKRRHRYKVRTRTYCDSGDCLLEVKGKGYRGQTVKQRIAHDATAARQLDSEARQFAADIVGPDAHRLGPAVETRYERITLSRGPQRVTCDLGLQLLEGDWNRNGPDDVLVETNSDGARGLWDELLRIEGIRSESVSKYGVAASLLRPELPRSPWHRVINRYFTRG